MLKPVLDTLDTLKGKLFMMPEIVDKLHQKENNSTDHLICWLRETEEILRKSGYAQCAEMAGLRSRILAAEFSEERRYSKKKEKIRIALEIIYDAQSVIIKLIAPMEDKVNEVRMIINQILLIFKPSGILEYDEKYDFNVFIQGIWHMFKANEQVGGGISKILTFVNQSDAIRILAEEIDLEKPTHKK
ncbi:MAG TPA: hypothetical protein PKC39_16045 [Ferruginibacter sp.]|nr:hypothetical protein [Ferruginibacter sp.]HMP22469.1 hypothetical protein [Ferruginibacter sp.]